VRIAPNAALTVGRAFPGEGSERNAAELGTRTRRNVRVRPEPRIRDRIQMHQDIDPPMTALLLRAPWKRPKDVGPLARAADTTMAGGTPHPGGCGCGAH
jgi:hypothetical protein